MAATTTTAAADADAARGHVYFESATIAGTRTTPTRRQAFLSNNGRSSTFGTIGFVVTLLVVVWKETKLSITRIYRTMVGRVAVRSRSNG